MLAERAADLAAIHQAAGEILAALDLIQSASTAAWYGIRRATQEVAAIAGDRAAGA